MAKFEPHFWEVSLPAETLERFCVEDGLYYEHPDEAEQRYAKAEHSKAVWSAVRTTADAALTSRQREVLELYFFEHLTQEQTAERLGISQQSVSEHIYGKTRNGGHAVGGALRKLRKICTRQGYNNTNHKEGNYVCRKRTHKARSKSA